MSCNMISITFFVIFSLLVCLMLNVGLSSADSDLDEVVVKNETKFVCETDRDCSEMEYCREKKYCVQCYSCIRFNRYNSRQRCARTVKDCGPCLSGYIDDTTGPRKLVCVPLVTLAQPRMAENPNEFAKIVENYNWIGIAAIGFLAITAFVSWQCYRKKRTVAVISDSWQELGLGPQPRHSSPCGNNYNASSPPPAYDDFQTASGSDNGSVSYSFNLRVTEHPETKTTAVPFQLPFGEHVIGLAPPNYENSPADDENLADVPVAQSETDHPTASSSNIDLQDEATQPSIWTPGPSYFTSQTDETDSAESKEEKVTPPSKRRKTEDTNDLNFPKDTRRVFLTLLLSFNANKDEQ